MIYKLYKAEEKSFDYVFQGIFESAEYVKDVQKYLIEYGRNRHDKQTFISWCRAIPCGMVQNFTDGMKLKAVIA